MAQPEVSGNERVSDRAEPGLQAAEGGRPLTQATRRGGVFGVQSEIAEEGDQRVHVLRVSQGVVGLADVECLQRLKERGGAPPMLTRTGDHRVLEVPQLLGRG